MSREGGEVDVGGVEGQDLGGVVVKQRFSVTVGDGNGCEDGGE